MLGSVVLFTLLLFPSISGASGKIYINVGQAKVKKSLLALPGFQYYGSAANKSHLQLGQDLFNVVSNDLNVSGFFTFIKSDAFLEDTSKVGLRPAPGASNGFNFASWKVIGTEFLVRAGYRVNGDKISLETYLYYVPQAKNIFAKTYEGKRNDVRKIAHTFANDIIESLTGKKSFFLSKVVVSSNKGAHGGGKEIWIMDWDGANPKKVTNHRSIAISPTWSPDGKKIAYTAYAYHKRAKMRNADLFLYDLTNTKRWLVSYRKGINSGAHFTPDGKNILLTISKKGNPDIYKIDLNGKNLRQVTFGPRGAMNVEPAMSPDGKKIAFSSTRGGRPMIYVMNANGRNIQRVTTAGRYNASPAWSPDGKKIAFAGYDKGHFDIFIMNTDGTSLQRLTSAKKANGKWADNENPSFSPDGRNIMFVSNRTGHNQIYVINTDGTNERRITVDRHSYFQPKWSPHLD
jgi:TolB protein